MKYSKKIEELNKLKMEIENSDDLDETIELYSKSLKVYGDLKKKLDEIETKFEKMKGEDE